MSSSGGMINSGRSIANDCMAVAESLEPILLNIANEATVVIPLTNLVTSALESCDSTGGTGTQVFRYLSLPQMQQHTPIVFSSSSSSGNSGGSSYTN